LDWQAIAGVAGAVIAVGALVFSYLQWRDAHESDRLRLLLGEKETVAYEASRIAAGQAKVSRDVLDALMLAALFESSDRARIQVYRALDILTDDDRKVVLEVRSKYVRAALTYEPGLDLKNFCERLGQLDAAVTWISAGDGETEEELIQEICPQHAARRQKRT